MALFIESPDSCLSCRKTTLVQTCIEYPALYFLPVFSGTSCWIAGCAFFLLSFFYFSFPFEWPSSLASPPCLKELAHNGTKGKKLRAGRAVVGRSHGLNSVLFLCYILGHFIFHPHPSSFFHILPPTIIWFPQAAFPFPVWGMRGHNTVLLCTAWFLSLTGKINRSCSHKCMLREE